MNRRAQGKVPAPSSSQGTWEGAQISWPPSKGGDELLPKAPGTCPWELNCSPQGDMVPREGGHNSPMQPPWPMDTARCAQLGAEAAQCRVCRGSGAELRAGTCPPLAQCQGGGGGGPWCSRSGASLARGWELAHSLCPHWSAPRLSTPVAGKGEQSLLVTSTTLPGCFGRASRQGGRLPGLATSSPGASSPPGSRLGEELGVAGGQRGKG